MCIRIHRAAISIRVVKRSSSEGLAPFLEKSRRLKPNLGDDTSTLSIRLRKNREFITIVTSGRASISTVLRYLWPVCGRLPLCKTLKVALRSIYDLTLSPFKTFMARFKTICCTSMLALEYCVSVTICLINAIHLSLEVSAANKDWRNNNF
jgi:hypothetical protein